MAVPKNQPSKVVQVKLSGSGWTPSIAMLQDTTDAARVGLDILFNVMSADTATRDRMVAAAGEGFEALIARLDECCEVDRDRVTKKTLEWIAHHFPQALVYGPNLVCHSYHHAALRLARHVYMAWDVLKGGPKGAARVGLAELSEVVRIRGIALTKREVYELGANLTVEARRAIKVISDHPMSSEPVLLDEEKAVLDTVRGLKRPSPLKEFLQELESQGIGESTAKGILSRLVKRGLLHNDRRRSGGYWLPPKV